MIAGRAPVAATMEADVDDLHLAQVLAGSTGDLLEELRADCAGLEPSELGRRARARAGSFLASQLIARCPMDSVLSGVNAGSSDPRARRTWLIGALDGAEEFATGRRDWGVSVALRSGGVVTAAAVALPGLDMLLSIDSRTPPYPGEAQRRLVVERGASAALVDAVAVAIGGRAVRAGSVAYRTAAVVRGEADAHLHLGRLPVWDVAAPVAVARAAGLHTSLLNGSEVPLDRPDHVVPDLIICRRELAPELLRIVSAMPLTE
ncbi:3'(2'),5'-bisphosphate nucleotidase CysQ [Occultella glacieicola]|uniref:3'(2'),5'-bisphosphate nucleotidase CysQ n=1 Tax=Occultella glacieicola TaxID=2518684 RepID=A0ABY2DXU7_9MICO|nr:inositol monophosphatase family protein [Occultella glacieicola]TDE88498.1 3'(2'),5'-bisphosphate nucleotidase CysQ [Occultella glacieicola]